MIKWFIIIFINIPEFILVKDHLFACPVEKTSRKKGSWMIICKRLIAATMAHWNAPTVSVNLLTRRVWNNIWRSKCALRTWIEVNPVLTTQRPQTLVETLEAMSMLSNLLAPFAKRVTVGNRLWNRYVSLLKIMRNLTLHLRMEPIVAFTVLVKPWKYLKNKLCPICFNLQSFVLNRWIQFVFVLT